MNRAAIFVVLFISKLFKLNGLRACRFHPTCSEFSAQAYKSLGFFEATRLTVMRLGRCHPFSQGGYEPLTKIKEA